MVFYIILDNMLLFEQTTASNFIAQTLLKTQMTLPIKFFHALDLWKHEMNM